MVTAAAVVGALIGGRLTALVNPDSLRKAFGWFVLVMSSVILAEEVHPRSGSPSAVLAIARRGRLLRPQTPVRAIPRRVQLADSQILRRTPWSATKPPSPMC